MEQSNICAITIVRSEIRKILYEMARPGNYAKKKIWYHGTNTYKKVKSIIKNGVVPQNLEKNRFGFSPQLNRAYFTTSLSEALSYTYSGIKKETDYGYIIEIDGGNLTDLTIDEDKLNFVIQYLYGVAAYDLNITKKQEETIEKLAEKYVGKKHLYYTPPRNITRAIIEKSTDEEQMWIIKNFSRGSVANKGIVYPDRIYSFKKMKFVPNEFAEYENYINTRKLIYERQYA